MKSYYSMLNKYMKEVKTFMIREGEKREKNSLFVGLKRKKMKTKKTRSQKTYMIENSLTVNA